MLPQPVIERLAPLTASAHKVYCYLWAIATSQWSISTYAAIAKGAKISRRSVRIANEQLRDAGLIEILTGTGGKSNRYRIVPVWLLEQAAPDESERTSAVPSTAGKTSSPNAVASKDTLTDASYRSGRTDNGGDGQRLESADSKAAAEPESSLQATTEAVGKLCIPRADKTPPTDLGAPMARPEPNGSARKGCPQATASVIGPRIEQTTEERRIAMLIARIPIVYRALSTEEERVLRTALATGKFFLAQLERGLVLLTRNGGYAADGLFDHFLGALAYFGQEEDRDLIERGFRV